MRWTYRMPPSLLRGWPRGPGHARTAPATAHRPERTRSSTAASRIATRAASPAQIPTSPQPNTSDAQVSGRNPAAAATRVHVRRYAASPAPSSTPSRANTTPAAGWSPAKNHQAAGTAASTAGSVVNTRGSGPASAANSRPKPDPSTSP